MPPVPKHTRANRANGAKAQAHHEAAKSMEKLTAAHAALTAAHAAVTADLLSSQQLYSQLRERHISLMVFAGQRDQQWELDLLGYMQQKGLAAARTELAHTKQQLTTTNSKLEQLRAQVAAANKGLSKDHKDKWNLLMRSRVSLPFLRGMLSSQGTKPATQPACHPATQSTCLARPRNQERDTHTGGYTAEYILSHERLLCLPGVSAEQLGTLCTAVVGAVFPGADPGRQASATTHRRNHDLLQTYIHEAHTVWLRRSFAVHVQLDGCTIPAHGKVVLYRVTAAVRCFSPSPAAAAAPAPAVGSPSPAPAAAAGSPSPAPAPAVGSPSPAPAAAAGSPSSAPAPLPTARTPEVQEMSSPTPQLEVKARVVAVRKCPDSSSYPAVQQFVDVCRKQGVWGSLASITVDSAAGNIGRISGLAVSINALRRQQGLALIIFWPCVSHQIHNALHKAMTTWGKAEGWGRQGLQAQLALSIEQLCSLTKKHWDLLGLSVQHCAQPSEPSQSRWGSYVDACSSLTRVLKPVTAAVTGIMERQGKAAPAWAGDLWAAGQPCSLGLRTHLVEFFGAAPSSNHAVESSLQHTKHGNSAKQGLDAMIGSINNKLDPGALANIDLADFEARLLTLRKQKRDKETTSADDNREAKAARKTEESACMVDGNAKMVLNVPTQVPLQQLHQAFQQHARGADYSNTSAKEATRFTREQLRAYLLYHKVPPRDQPVGNTLVAGWQKAVHKHIAERGSPTGHGVLP
ncbi:hypothetical protein QJQ45_005498 [Haematococcus lacustris]|nr:hypothetical protein QJQ45_005498 [Haematococcus lacustris]